MMPTIFALLFTLWIPQASNVRSTALTKDVFPLAVNRVWSYSYQYYLDQCRDFVLNCYGYADAGNVTYSVTGSTIASDSITWNIKVVRTLQRHQYDPFMKIDTNYIVKDSSTFHLFELLSGNHQLFADSISMVANPVWAFMRLPCNAGIVYRFQETSGEGISSVASCISGRSYLPDRHPSFIFKADSGLLSNTFSYSSISTHDGQAALLTSATLTSVQAPPTSREIPASPRLNPVFPDPFNPSAMISFSLLQSEVVSVQVFNSLGQPVASIVEGFLKAGNHSYQWNSGQLAAGVYIVRLRAGNYIEAKKCVLLK